MRNTRGQIFVGVKLPFEVDMCIFLYGPHLKSKKLSSNLSTIFEIIGIMFFLFLGFLSIVEFYSDLFIKMCIEDTTAV